MIKGALVELYGRISINTWTNAEGEAKASLNFHVNNIKLHGKPDRAANDPKPFAASGKGKNRRTAAVNADAITEPTENLPF